MRNAKFYETSKKKHAKCKMQNMISKSYTDLSISYKPKAALTCCIAHSGRKYRCYNSKIKNKKNLNLIKEV